MSKWPGVDGYALPEPWASSPGYERALAVRRVATALQRLKPVEAVVAARLVRRDVGSLPSWLPYLKSLKMHLHDLPVRLYLPK